MVSSMTALLIIAVTALFTFLTRAVPFLFFGGKKTSPPWILFLGRVLPPAIAILVIYCLRNITLTASPFGIPEIIAVLTAAGLQKYKHNNLLSILCSTVLYMIMVQTIFSA
jgi:branched-subunit amino acid transport protein AzlD